MRIIVIDILLALIISSLSMILIYYLDPSQLISLSVKNVNKMKPIEEIVNDLFDSGTIEKISLLLEKRNYIKLRELMKEITEKYGDYILGIQILSRSNKISCYRNKKSVQQTFSIVLIIDSNYRLKIDFAGE